MVTPVQAAWINRQRRKKRTLAGVLPINYTYVVNSAGALVVSSGGAYVVKS